MVVRVFDSVANEYPDLHLILAGGWGWETATIKQTLEASPFRERIKLLGYVDREDKPALYRNAKALLFPSFYEGFGLPPVEAMAERCPVLASNTSSMPEILKNGAFLLPPHDLGAFRRALVAVLSGDPSVESQVNIAQQLATGFDWTQTVATTIEIFS